MQAKWYFSPFYRADTETQGNYPESQDCLGVLRLQACLDTKLTLVPLPPKVGEEGISESYIIENLEKTGEERQKFPCFLQRERVGLKAVCS